MNSRIIAALDVPNLEEAVALARKISPGVASFKLGNELAEACGVGAYRAVERIVQGGGMVFRDGKFMDIPRTVGASVRAIVQPGLSMLNVMCLGGAKMMATAKETAIQRALELGIPTPLVLGVTVLTSLDYDDLVELGLDCGVPIPGWYFEETIKASRASRVQEIVVKLAKLAKTSGLDGVVCSAREAAGIREACGDDFIIVSPGIRSKTAPPDDQKRTMTVAEAITAGVDYMVIGRPIVAAENPLAAVMAFNVEAEEALAA